MPPPQRRVCQSNCSTCVALSSFVSVDAAKSSACRSVHAIGILETTATMGLASSDGVLDAKRFQEGAMSFFPAGKNYAIATDRPFRETLIFIDDETIAEAVNAQPDIGRVDLHFRPLTGGLAAQIAEMIRSVVKSGVCQQFPMIVENGKRMLMAAVVREMRDAYQANLTQSQPGLSREKLRRVVEFVDANISRGLSNAELAEVAAMSPFHFSRLFQKSMGETPARYVMGRRVFEARRLLRSTDLQMARVAADAGFSSQSHMNEVFERLVGETPGEYRRGIG